jgi:hypothetical protein
MRGKIFSREEADRMVPLIRRIVVNIRARQRLLHRRHERSSGSAEERLGDRSEGMAAKTARRLREEIKGYSSELEALGCFLRDAERGVVECYGELRGDIVYFTWQPSQPEFTSWHPLDQSFVNRQPLPGLESRAAL